MTNEDAETTTVEIQGQELTVRRIDTQPPADWLAIEEVVRLLRKIPDPGPPAWHMIRKIVEKGIEEDISASEVRQFSKAELKAVLDAMGDSE